MHSVIAVIIQHGAVVKEMKFPCFAKVDETACRSGVFNRGTAVVLHNWSQTYFVDEIEMCVKQKYNIKLTLTSAHVKKQQFR